MTGVCMHCGVRGEVNRYRVCLSCLTGAYEARCMYCCRALTRDFVLCLGLYAHPECVPEAILQEVQGDWVRP